jgi:hypothetical protein
VPGYKYCKIIKNDKTVDFRVIAVDQFFSLQYLTMTPQREASVRFTQGHQQQQQQQQQQQWSVPPFSPTQLPILEKVLHSIFSPACHSKKTQARRDNNDDLSSANHLLPIESIDWRAHQPAPKTPVFKSKQISPRTPGSSTEFFHTPKADLSRQSNPWHTSTDSDFDDDAEDKEEEMFFSPQSANGFSPLSAISAVTEPTMTEANISFKNATERGVINNISFKTIDMLNHEYVSNCQSASKLQRVVDNLKEENPDSSLLDSATDRMESLKSISNTIRQTTTSSNHADNNTSRNKEASSPGQVFGHDCAVNISQITTGNSTLDQSKCTLNMSLSPSSGLLGETFLSTPNVPVPVPVDTPGRAYQRSYSLSSKRLRPIVEVETPLQTMIKTKERNLSEEVKRLAIERIELEAIRMTDQQSFFEKLEKLENAKQQAEHTVQNMQGKVTTASVRTKDLIESMHKIQKESIDMRKNFELERATREQKHQQARDLEDLLRRKVRDLTAELSRVEEHSRAAVGEEMGKRMHVELDLSEKNRRNEELNQLLHVARTNLEHLKRGQTQFRIGMLNAMGVDDSKVRRCAAYLRFKVDDYIYIYYILTFVYFVVRFSGRRNSQAKPTRIYGYFFQKDCVNEGGQ